MDRQFKKVGQDMSAISRLDSCIHNPVFGLRSEFRDMFFPPTATLLVKV
jgi:hypothetical protein